MSPPFANAEVARDAPAYRAADRTFRERVRATSQLVAGILHEFNSPLGALRSCIDTARLGLSRVVDALDTDPIRARRMAEQVDEILGIAKTASDRILDTVETLSHFGRVDRADVDEVELGTIIETALRLSGASRAAGVRIVRRYEPTMRVRCRVREVEHILYHVIRNACEALNGRRSPMIRIDADRTNDVVSIVVQDNGPGIPPADLPTLFEPSLATRGDTVSLGLSLATCRYIAQEHGGALEGANVAEGGARFTLRFREEPAA